MKTIDILLHGIDGLKDRFINVKFIGNEIIIIEVHDSCKETLLEEPVKALHSEGGIYE